LTEIRDQIERFIEASREPVLLEPGEEPLTITPENFALELRNGTLTLQAWNEQRNFVRRVIGIERQAHGRLVLSVERFGKRPGVLEVIDAGDAAARNAMLRGERLELCERFRRFLLRQFPGSTLSVLSTEPDLEHSLSPSYPRALVQQGADGWAGIAADPMHADGVLTFGLIWLDYLRRRQSNVSIHGLALYLPAGQEKTTCLRLRLLDTDAAQFVAFVYCDSDWDTRVDISDYGNLDTELEHCRRRLPSPLDSLIDSVVHISGVEAIELAAGEISLRVHGTEFARTSGEELLFGLKRRRRARPADFERLRRLAQQLSKRRSTDAADHLHALYLAHPESWLESQVRTHLQTIDAMLCPAPVYAHVPAFAGMERGILDLLAVDATGRLAVLELKASQDIHLPLQALDYWMRVEWHRERGEFTSNGYFPGIELSSQPARLLLVSPAMEFHPSVERVLRFFSPTIPVARLGVGLQWRKELKIVSAPDPPCLSTFYRTSKEPSAI